jgi:elongation factor Ts
MDISITDVKKLRSVTGAGMMDAKQALAEAQGDIDKAIEILRKRGQKVAAKKADRQAVEGLVGVYLHANGKLAALVEVNCETDFVARTEEFKNFANDLAMQVAAMNPQYLSPEDVPEEVKEKEKEIYAEEMKDSGKPAEVMEKIIAGKLEKFYSENCLLRQTFIKDDSISIEKYLTDTIGKIGENIKIKRFVRYSI